jgi:hypothetical protein
MRFYNRQHGRDCGIDLHVKTMYVCVLDATGQVLVHRTATISSLRRSARSPGTGSIPGRESARDLRDQSIRPLPYPRPWQSRSWYSSCAS